MKENVITMVQDEIDFVAEKLSNKECPIHSRQMDEIRPYVFPDGYRRDRYKCPVCNCKADFVGDELKTDSIAQTIDHILIWKADYPGNTLPISSSQ